MDRSSKQRINKNMAELNDTLDQMDLIDIHKTFYPKEAKYTFFSSVHGTFSKIDHMIGHKATSTNSRKLKSYQASSHNGNQPQGKNSKTFKLMETK